MELKEKISIREQIFKFLNKALPVCPVHEEIIKHKERRYLKFKVPFQDKISSLGIIKLLGLDTYDILTMNVKFQRNKVFSEATNASTQVRLVDQKEL